MSECAFKILAQQLVKGIRRAVPVEDLPEPVVEQHLHSLDLSARELPHGHRILRGQRHQQRKPGGAFYEGAERRGIGMAHE